MMTYELEDSWSAHDRVNESEVGVFRGFLERYSTGFFSQQQAQPPRGFEKSDADMQIEDEDEEDGKPVALTTKAGLLTRKSMMWARDSIEKFPLKLSVLNTGIFTILISIIMPRTITYMLIYPTFRLVVGNLYPAYASYKAVRTKNVKEYVKWMMYWIVFALFTLVEYFADIFVSFWFPFYYEAKILFLVWLLCPATKGSSIIYRRFLHPTLTEREAEIDDAIARITEQGYTAVLQLGTKGVNYATNVLMQTAIKNVAPVVSETLQSLKSDSAISSLVNNKPQPSSDSRKKGLRDRTDGSEVENHHQASKTRPKSSDSNIELISVSDDEFELSDGTARGIAEALESDDTNSGESFLHPNIDEDKNKSTGDHKYKMKLRQRGRRLMVIDSDEESDNES